MTLYGLTSLVEELRNQHVPLRRRTDHPDKADATVTENPPPLGPSLPARLPAPSLSCVPALPALHAPAGCAEPWLLCQKSPLDCNHDRDLASLCCWFTSLVPVPTEFSESKGSACPKSSQIRVQTLLEQLCRDPSLLMESCTPTQQWLEGQKTFWLHS